MPRHRPKRRLHSRRSNHAVRNEPIHQRRAQLPPACRLARLRSTHFPGSSAPPLSAEPTAPPYNATTRMRRADSAWQDRHATSAARSSRMRGKLDPVRGTYMRAGSVAHDENGDADR
jgi:hypothetical protein